MTHRGSQNVASLRRGLLSLAASLLIAPVLFAQPSTPATSLTDVPPEPVVVKPAKPQDKYKFDKDRRFLASVTDFQEPDAPFDRENFLKAYFELVLHARKFPTQELEKFAISVPWMSLFREERFGLRYELLKFEGKLMRVIPIAVPAELASEGVTELYEAWLFVEQEERAVCFLITELPPGIIPAVRYEPAIRATIAGYFFRIMTYDSEQVNKETGKTIVRRAPLLMAHSLTINSNPGEKPSKWSTGFIPSIIASVALLTALVLGLAYWFRSSDRAAKQAIARRRAQPNLPPPAADTSEWETDSPTHHSPPRGQT
jgi:hypothetical protein